MSLLKSSEHVSLPPQAEAIISVRLTNKAARHFDSKYALIKPFITAMQRGFYVAKALIAEPNQNNLTCYVFNAFDKMCKIPRNFIVGTLSSVAADRIDTKLYSLGSSQANIRFIALAALGLG